MSGRGELHLAILIENLRREGYELQVSRPEVIERYENGQRLEPFEQLEIEVSQEGLGSVVELAGRRRGELLDMKYRDDGSAHCVYKIPTRGLLGFRQALLTSTRGQGVMNTLFAGYGPYAGPIATREFGSLIAFEAGETSTFGLAASQDRGTLFIGANDGMLHAFDATDGHELWAYVPKMLLRNGRSYGADRHADDAGRLAGKYILPIRT